MTASGGDDGYGIPPDQPVPPTSQLNEGEEDDTPPLRVLVFDTQTTYARLFSKSMLQHLRLGHINHPYVIPATLGVERFYLHPEIGNENTKKTWNGRVAAAHERATSMTYERATNKLLTDADKLEQKGETVFVTEYAPFVMKHDVMLSALRKAWSGVKKASNPTVIPDDFLALLSPVIFIQHPAKVIPAWFRLSKNEYGSFTIDDEDDFTIWTSIRWSRILFDYIRGSNKRPSLGRNDSASSVGSSRPDPGIVATRPFIIDAEDVANHPHSTLVAICRLLGLEFDASSGWTQYFGRATEALKKAIPSSLLKFFSSATQGQGASSIDIDQEMTGWRAEFGNEVAEMLRKRVEEDMPHYNYLKSFQVQILPFMQNSIFTGLPGRRQSAGGAVNPSPLKIIQRAMDGNPRGRQFSW